MSPNCPLLNPYLPLTCLCDALWHEEQDFLFGPGQGILSGGQIERMRSIHRRFPLFREVLSRNRYMLGLGDGDDEHMRVAVRTGDGDGGMRDDRLHNLRVGLFRGGGCDGDGAFVIGVEDRIEVSVSVHVACP